MHVWQPQWYDNRTTATVAHAKNASQVVLKDARVIFFACNGVTLGGPQYRCMDTARAMTSQGVPAICIPNCEPKTLARLEGLHFDGIVFVKTIPMHFQLLHNVVRRATCRLLLDAMDLNPQFQRTSCNDAKTLRLFDGTIANTRTSWSQIRHYCPALANATAATSLHFIEHFHTVTHRVSDGTQWPARPNALLLMEHRVFPNEKAFCAPLGNALRSAGVKFDCNPLWGGPNANTNRVHYFSRALHLSIDEVNRRIGEEGPGPLFTASFTHYDLLVQWYTTKTAQRLNNALATGVPTIALTNAAFEEVVAGTPDILLVHNYSELTSAAMALAKSKAYRRRVSDAGIAVAKRFSREAITLRYLSALDISVSGRLGGCQASSTRKWLTESRRARDT